jgi:hypothetical protein
MKTIQAFRTLSIITNLLLLSSCATTNQRPVAAAKELPAEIAMNRDAGRGGFLFVTLRLEDGEELPFIVDTASPVTFFSKSLEPKLGKRLSTWTFSKYGEQVSGRYLTPQLYLGDAPLITGSNVFTFDYTELSLRSGQPIMGALGLDCLRHYCIQMDFESGVMRFLDPDRLDTSQLGRVFPLMFSSLDETDKNQWHSYPVINYTSLTGGENVRLAIDTGCNIDGLVEKNLAQKQTTRLSEVVWNGQTYTNIHVGVVERANVLGLRFLARHLVTLNFPKQAMYLKQTSIGPLQVIK